MSEELEKHSLSDWVRYLNEEEMPVFAHTARSLAAVSGKIDTPVAELSHLILQDSSMTARVLRLANSVYYNPAGKPINTVSVAILMLGFNEVRSIALSIAMIDTILRGIQHEHVVEEMARSLHAAVQAKAIAKARGVKDIEEVFIAALLFRLGNMAFWCFPRRAASTLDAEYSVVNNEADAEIKILGFKLSQLSAALNDEWHLSRLLSEMFNDKKRVDAQVTDIDQAYDLVNAVEEGWGSINTRETIKAIAERTSLTFEDTMEMVQQSAKTAAQTAIEYGAVNAGKMINLPEKIDLEMKAFGQDKQSFEPDLNLQLGILRELTIMLRDKVDLNTVLGTVLEGIYRSLGMDRTVLAFINPQENLLKAKYVYGKDSTRFENCFEFTIADKEANLLANIVSRKESFWLNKTNIEKYNKLINTQVKKCLGVLEFFAMPLIIGGTVKGLIYADCKQSGRRLKQEDFQTFCHFCEHANIALDLLASRQS
jgi:HD-like signal output (HDOD) protein